jgi:hypothetical protein
MAAANQHKVPDSHHNSVFIGTYDRVSCVSPNSTAEEFPERAWLVSGSEVHGLVDYVHPVHLVPRVKQVESVGNVRPVRTKSYPLPALPFSGSPSSSGELRSSVCTTLVKPRPQSRDKQGCLFDVLPTLPSPRLPVLRFSRSPVLRFSGSPVLPSSGSPVDLGLLRNENPES